MKLIEDNLVKISFFLLLLLSLSAWKVQAQTMTSKFEKAMKYYEQKNYGEALNQFRLIQSQDFADDKLYSSAKFYMAECLVRLNQVNYAIARLEDFTKNYKLSSLRPLALYNLGTLYYENSEYEKSRRKLLSLIKDYPQSKFVGSSYFFIGNSYLKQNMYVDAENFLNLAVSNSNTNNYITNCIYSLGSLYEYEENYSKAVSYYDELLTYHQTSKLAPLAQLRIGVSYFKLQDYDNAVLELTNPLIQKLSHKQQSEAYFLLANSYIRLKQFNSASEIYNKILNSAKSDLEKEDVKFGLAWIDFQVNNFEAAYKIFNELKDSPIDSMRIKSLYWGAESKRYLGDEKKAVLLYTEFLNKFSDSKFSSNVKFSLASIYYKRNKKAKAKKILLSSLNVSSPNPKCEIYTLLGEIVLEEKNYKSANNYFKIASEISSADSRLIQHAQLGMAVSKYYLNNFNEVITILNSLKKGKNIDVDINKLNYFLGESYFAVGKFSNAIDAFNLVSGKNSDLIRQSLYGKAYSYFNNRDYINAAFYFRNYVNNYKRIGNYYNAKLRLADSYYGTKEFKKSVKLFNELFALRNKLKLSDYSYYQYGQALYKAGNITKAVKELTVLQQKFPKSKYSDDAQFIIAWMYFKQNDYDRAIDEYNLVLQNYSKTPLKPIVFYSIGDSYFNKGSYENAISYYAKVIDDFPNSSYVYDAVSGIQYCYIAKDQPDNAVNFIDQFVENHPNSKYSAKILLKKGEIYFSNENYKSAENSYFELIQKYPQSKHVPNAHYWIGKSAAILSEDSTAEENFLKVIALSPKSEIGVSATLELGKIYNSKNQFDKAIKLYSDEAAKIPKSKRVPEILFVKAQAQLNAQKISEAFSTFNQIIYYYDKTIFGAKARIEMGLIELARQSFENAEILFKDLSEKRTDDLGAKAQYYYGLTLFEQNKIDDAISAFVRVESLFADYQEWYLKSLIKLGDCYVRLGNKKKAKSIYKSIYRKHKNDEYGREAKSKYKKL